MTTYSADFFDGLDGVLEQLVHAVIAQRQANLDYNASSVETDFVAESVTYDVVLTGSGEEAPDTGSLQISIRLRTAPYYLQVLRNRDSILRRIVTTNSRAVDRDAYAQLEPSYSQVSYPVQNIPIFLTDFTPAGKVENTLERRIYWLAREVFRLVRYSHRESRLRDYQWDRLFLDSGGSNSVDGQLIGSGYASKYTPTNAEITAEENELADSLVSGSLVNDILNPVDPWPYEVFGQEIAGAPNDAGGLEQYFGVDPAYNIGNKLGDLLQSELNSASGDDFGSPSDSTSGSGNSESPTLKDC